MSFSLTRKTDYALVALAALTREHSEECEPLSARQIAEQHDLPLPLLMNALKDLNRAGLVDSRRGAGGGYYLATDPRYITIRQIIEAMEGPLNVALCCDDHASPIEAAPTAERVICQIAANCPSHDPMQRLNHLLNEFLDSITLDNLTNGVAMPAMPQLGVPV
jgi:Rrf2 family protein